MDGLWPRPDWTDLADILVLAYLLYRLLALLRGRAALQVAVTLACLRLGEALARRAGLVLTSWVFEGINAAAVLIVVVVFRHEIREALIQSNPLRLLFGRPDRPVAADLSTAAEAAFRLGSTRTGALLVFAGRDKLAEHVRDGQPIGGRLSVPLLESLFYKGNPLHDGAVVVRGGRVERAGSLLPLSLAQGLPGHLGTRHRAALGLSEVCDATVVVVSEERGAVSVAHRGALAEVEGQALLEARLRALLSGAAADALRTRARLRSLVVGLLGYLSCVLIVGAGWGLYAGRGVAAKNVEVTVAYHNLPAELGLLEAPERVEVQVSGLRPLVEALQPEQVAVFVDLRGAQVGTQIVELSADRNVGLPLGLDVDRIRPPSLRVVLEPRVEADARVEPSLVGDVPPGYEAAYTVRPEAIRVSGPQSVIEGLDHLGTAPIGLDRLAADRPGLSVEVEPVYSPASLRPAAGQPRRVRVDVRLRPLTNEPSTTGSARERDLDPGR